MTHFVLNPPHIRWIPLFHIIGLYIIFVIIGIANSFSLNNFLYPIIPVLVVSSIILSFQPVLIITDKHFLVQSWFKYLLGINSGKIYPKQFIHTNNLRKEQSIGILLELASDSDNANKSIKTFQLYFPVVNGIRFSSLVGRSYLLNEIRKIEKIQHKWM